jgi:Uma2 family endonuclease
MVSIVKPSQPQPPGSEPAWDIARLFPDQGSWDEWDYLALNTNHLVEFADGYVEVLPMPDMRHQMIVDFMGDQLKAHVRPNDLGRVLLAPFRIKIRDSKFREPDVMFMLAGNASRMTNKFWLGADLVVEVVSDDAESRERDHTTKRADYAAAAIQEYWIVDPQDRKVTVLVLDGSKYAVHGEFDADDKATSRVLPGFAVDVDAIFAAGDA